MVGYSILAWWLVGAVSSWFVFFPKWRTDPPTWAQLATWVCLMPWFGPLITLMWVVIWLSERPFWDRPVWKARDHDPDKYWRDV